MSSLPDPILAADPLIDEGANRFMEDLSDAITAYGRAQVRDDVEALTYRGVDLSPVIERHLFFSTVNDEALYQAFRTRDADAPLSGASDLIRPYLLRETAADRPGLKAFARGIATRLRESVRPAPGDGEIEIAFHNGAEGRDVLFHIGAEKFLRYLGPVAQAFGKRSAFLIYASPHLLPALAGAGVPVVSVATAASSPVGPVTPTLRDWWSYCRDHDAMVTALRRAGCSRVVVAEGNSPPNATIAAAARGLGVRSICIQQGWSPIVHPGFRKLRFDVMCMWGDLFAELLRAHNPQQRFRTTGHHLMRMEDARPDTAPEAVGFFLQKNSRLITQAGWRAMLDLVAWTANAFPDRSVLVREHPGAPLTEEEAMVFAGCRNIELVPAQSAALADVLARCRVAVSIFSTTLIEAINAGAVPLIVNLTGSRHFSPDLAAAGAGVEVRDMDSARDRLRDLLDTDFPRIRAGMAALRPRLFAQTGPEALHAIVRAIDPRHGVRESPHSFAIG